MPSLPRLTAGLLGITLLCHAAGAELLFGVAPRSDPETSHSMYQPLLTYLSKALGEEIRYERASNWLAYQRDTRNSRYDLTFDEPHLIAWRMVKRRYQPLVNLPSPLKFHIVAGRDNPDLQQAQDLVNRRVCVLAPPSLPALLLLKDFPDPIRQPRLEAIQNGSMAVFQAFRDGRCEAAVLSDAFLEHTLDDADRGRVRIIHSSGDYPNLALTASPQVSPDQRQRIIESLLYEEGGAQASAALRKRLDPEARNLVVSSGPDYIVHSYFLLQKAIFGW